MGLPTKSFAQMLNDLVAGWQAATGITAQLQSGDPLLAAFQSVNAQLQFLQALAEIVTNLTRASTSTGADLDTWMADFGFPRLGSTLAEGSETFATLTVHSFAITISPGVTVQTQGGAIQYQVIADPTQSAWSPSLNAYVLPANTLSITATVQALTGGSASNVTAGLLTQLATPIPGIDTVNNAGNITNGIDAESDTSFRARFVLFLGTLAEATENAILSAILNVQQGLSVSLVENVNLSDVQSFGQFVAVVDDGSGAPPSSLLSTILAAVNKVRAFTVLPNVIAPSVVAANTAIVVRLAPGAVAGTVNAAVQAAVTALENTTGIGNTLYISAIEAAALAITGVISVQPGQTKINGTNADLTATAFQEIRAGTITVSNY